MAHRECVPTTRFIASKGGGKRHAQDASRVLGMIAEPTGTDGLRLRCRQFYTSSNYPPQPSPRSSKKSLQKLLFRLWLRRSADHAPKTYPMAFQRMNGNLSCTSCEPRVLSRNSERLPRLTRNHPPSGTSVKTG